METTVEAGDVQRPLLCNNCDVSLSKYWCLDCNGALCDDCELAHRRVSVTRVHRLRNHPQAANMPARIEYCRVHRAEPLELYCFTCNKFTCKDCQLADHRSHRHEFVRNVVSSLKKQLECYVQPIAVQKETVRRSLEDMQKRLQWIEQNKEKLKTNLLQCFLLVLRYLKAQMKDIFSHALTVYGKETQQLLSRIEKLKRMQQIHLIVTETTEKAQNSPDLPTVIGYTKQICSQMKDVRDQDLYPPQTMSHIRIFTNNTAIKAICDFAKLDVLSVPFAGTNQNDGAPSPSPGSVPSPDVTVLACELAKDCLATLNQMTTSSGSFPHSDSSPALPVNLTAKPNHLQPEASLSVPSFPRNQEPNPQRAPSAAISPFVPIRSGDPSSKVPPQSSSQSLCSPPSSASSSSSSSSSFSSSSSSSLPSTKSYTFPLHLSQSRQIPSNAGAGSDFAPSVPGPVPQSGPSSNTDPSLSVNNTKELSRVPLKDQNLSFYSLLTSTSLPSACSSSSSSSSCSVFPPRKASLNTKYTDSCDLIQRVPNNTNPHAPISSSFSSQTSSSSSALTSSLPVSAPKSTASTVTTSKQPTQRLNPTQTATTSSPVQPISNTVHHPAEVSLPRISAVPNRKFVMENPSDPTLHYTPFICTLQPVSTIRKRQPVPLSAHSILPKTIHHHVQAPLVNNPSSVVVMTKPHATVIPVGPELPMMVYTLWNRLKQKAFTGKTSPLISKPVELDPQTLPAAAPSLEPSCSAQTPTAGDRGSSGRLQCTDPLPSPSEEPTGSSTADRDTENEPTSTVMEETKEHAGIKPATTVIQSEEQEPAEDEPTSTVPEEPETTENQMITGSSGEASPAEHNATTTTTTCEETETLTYISDEDVPAESPSSPETYGCTMLPPWSLNASRWQPTVSLSRLPLPLLHRNRRKLPRFRLLPGDNADEIYLQEIEEDLGSESDSDDDSVQILDFAEPLSSPGTAISLEVLSCSVCVSSDSLIICSSCARGFHRECHIPPIKKDIALGWTCSLCQDLADPADPYSSERTWCTQSPGLSLQSQRGCESLLLFLKVECCSRLSEFASWSHLERVSERLTLQRPPAYRTAVEFVSDIWAVFEDVSQDEALKNLQQSFQQKVEETLSLEVPFSPAKVDGDARIKNIKRRLKDLLNSVEPKRTKRQ